MFSLTSQFDQTASLHFGDFCPSFIYLQLDSTKVIRKITSCLIPADFGKMLGLAGYWDFKAPSKNQFPS